MAKPDHAAFAYLSNTSADPLAPALPGAVHALGMLESPQRPRPKTADIAMAVYALSRLLADSHAHHHARANDLPTEPSRWPLTSVYTEGLAAAVHYLNEYASLLGHGAGPVR